jgi:hypothetical protein
MEENREFSLDGHRLVKPLADHFIGVRLDYYQQRGAWKGEFWKRMGDGFDTADQAILAGDRAVVDGHRCWKNNKGFRAAELLEIARKHPGRSGQKDLLRLSWFLLDPARYREDSTDPGANQRAATAEFALVEARKVRRPLVRVDGPALALLEEDQAFLKRHLRQFWWWKGDPRAPARLVVLHPHRFTDGARATELSGAMPAGKVPDVLDVLDLSGAPDLAAAAVRLDEAWRKYMSERPSNADNLTFGKELIPKFKAVDAFIRGLAAEGSLLAPGGRPLLK